VIAGVIVLLGAAVAATLAVSSGSDSTKKVAALPRTAAAGPTTAPSTSTSVAAVQNFATLYAQDSSGVVRIDASTCSGSGVGSGFLVGPSLVATVGHVVDGAVAIGLTANGVTTVGHVLGLDPTGDLALVQSSAPLSGHLFTLASELPQVGADVGAIGFPEGGPVSFTRGTVSGLDRTINVGGTPRAGMIQTDAALNPGNSGGPLLLVNGTVIGLVDAGDTGAQGISFAVPAATAAPLLSSWRSAPAPPPPPSCQNALGPSGHIPVGSSGGGPLVQEITAALTTYFNAINNGDYASAYAQLSPAEQATTSESKFASDLSTTYDFNVNVGAISAVSPGTGLVDVTFTSLQSPAQGPNGDTCDNWTLQYTMVQFNGSWLIQSANGQGGNTHTSCA
jgi:S1-C subfamily serine protease